MESVWWSVKEEIMAEFYQSGQHVNNEYNAGRDIHFGAVQNQNDLAAQLEELKQQFVQAQEAGLLNEETATNAEKQVAQAAQQASNQAPEKKSILDHLTTAKALIDDVAASSGLVTALVGAIEAVHKVFS
jgi:hypothetical protein